MAIVTLTTDWGTRDFYMSSVKGRLLTSLPDVTIVDITHSVAPFNIAQAGFILQNSFRDFPPGSIHLIAVNSMASKDTPHIAAVIEGHYFITADNGILNLISGENPEKLVEIDIPQDSNHFVFPTRDIFVKAAVHIAGGNSITGLGFKSQQKREVASWQASVEQSPDTGHDKITGQIIYVDNFGNCITNISWQQFQTVKNNRPFTVHLPAHSFKQQNLYDAYDEVDEGVVLALLSSTNMVEIAINKGKADRLLDLRAYDSTVIIEYTD